MLDLSIPRQFRPVPGSRRGEATAWILAVLSIGTATFAAFEGMHVGWGVTLLVGFFVLSGLLISFGNWVDRHTLLALDGSGVAFRNGLRNVRLPWEDVQSVQVLSARWGDRVYVVGKAARFSFRKAGKVEWQGEKRDQVGFAEGEQILKTILHAAGLEASRHEAQGGSYYLRE